MKKHTAVENLIDWMSKNQYFIGNDLLQTFEQAKSMEKEQIMDAFEDGHTAIINSEKYYNETYEK